LLVVGGFLALGACSNQAEGDRCDHLNDSDDCQSPLICTQAALLVGTTSDRCCPQDRSQATTAVCKAPISGIGSDASAPANTGPDASSDAADAASEASDAASDAADAADAPTDG
jgi:hypothetical protein